MQVMNEEVLATDRLERSAVRLEQAIADRISAVEKSAAKRVESLESEVNSLKSRLNSLQAEKMPSRPHWKTRKSSIASWKT